MLIAMVFAVLVLALWFPETRIGGVLRRLLIDHPARWLDRLKRGQVLLALVIFAALAAAWAIGLEDGVRVAGQMTAEGLTYAMAFDLATWLDVTAIALAIAVTLRFREAIRPAATQARQWAKRAAGLLMATFSSLARDRGRRARPTPRPRHGEDPDRPAPGFAWA
jgi:urease accessory protein UreF